MGEDMAGNLEDLYSSSRALIAVRREPLRQSSCLRPRQAKLRISDSLEIESLVQHAVRGNSSHGFRDFSLVQKQETRVYRCVYDCGYWSLMTESLALERDRQCKITRQSAFADTTPLPVLPGPVSLES